MILDLWGVRYRCLEVRTDGSLVKPLIREEPEERIYRSAVPGSVEHILFGDFEPECVQRPVAFRDLF